MFEADNPESLRRENESDGEAIGDEETSNLPSKKAKVTFDFYESDDDLENTHESQARKELEMYKREPKPAVDSDPLNWWRLHEGSYKLLSSVAKKYLSIPATSVEAERSFSDLGVLLTKRRLLLTGPHVDAQLFLKGKL